jgi:Domain of unknown function (DUF3943)
MRRWWENVRHPQWDNDDWYVNYLGHPYFGAISYIRARERRLLVRGVALSAFYEFGIEALFERPSYQDLIITPVAGMLLGALLFEPIRERILGKPELRWCDHLTLTVTDPLGAANSVSERSVGVQTDIRVQFFLPGLAPHAQFADHTTRPRTRRQEHHYRSPGVGIEFVFAGRRRSTRRAQYERPRGKRRGH